MSLKPTPSLPIPEETVRVPRRAFPKRSVAIRLRDEFGSLYQNQDFPALFPSHGQPGLAPRRLALVTVLQFLENLSDRQTAEAVRARIDWKYALGLDLTDPGFHCSVLTEFRARLIAGGAEQLLLNRMPLLVAGDASFCNRTLFRPMRERIDLLCRTRADVRLCWPAATGCWWSRRSLTAVRRRAVYIPGVPLSCSRRI